MDIKAFNLKIETIIELLSVDDLKSLHTEFIKRDCYHFSMAFNDPALEFSKLKDAVKNGILRMNIDDLKLIAPAPIKKAVEEFMKQDEDAPFVPAPEPQESSDYEDPYKGYMHNQQEQQQNADDTRSSPQQLPGRYEVDRKRDTRPVPDINSGTNIMPGKMIVCDTARRLLRSVAKQEGFHMTDPKTRYELPYALKGVNMRGDPVPIVRDSERKGIRISMVDLALYFLADIYRIYRKADQEAKVLEAEIGMFRRRNAQGIQKLHAYEMAVIADALEL